MESSVGVRTEVEEERKPLLQQQQNSYRNSNEPEEEENSSSSLITIEQPEEETVKPIISNDQNQRLVSLDVFRGLTIALMILVDDAGGAFPSINHSPWFGVTLADFVMPFFLFGVGVSITFVFKRIPNKKTATEKVITRTIKLFLLGLVLQGGYFHGRNHLTYGVDIDRIRWLGVLQRIAIGYFLAAISEIWLVGNGVVDSAVSFVKKYIIQWMFAVLLCSLYVGLLYGFYVPNWEFKSPITNLNSSVTNYSSGNQMVNCNVRGSLEPPCNAVGLIDRILLGEKHLYQHPVYRRTKECSVNSPDYGSLPPNSPGWCLAPFDPEGILSSLMAAVTCFIGLYYGHIIVHSKVDVKKYRRPTLLLQWMGMNALIVYALAACELFPALIQGLYWRSPENNLVNATESLLQMVFQSKRWGTLVFVLVEIVFWCLFAGYLHLRGIYVKL
ncbi:heparan-alpha-glucosaminide N-acetyltransferase-like isoform X2 [Papaver somniferum]|uniref:heparan-alpha-glucosaminide N-acetyltransferase-like isoform X2 n=1 Tax=Papaver somniferum TaxID=3469 RepID=UPI000E6FA598|nr:heparan-alpha-glucosaminide N-acetyltransferase-like isoform X2 [Papaver somniferum]